MRKHPDLPTRLPQTIDQLPPLPFDGQRRSFRLSYRPYEGPKGRGWGTEESALLSESGEWFRVPFGALGLDERTAYVGDLLGPGQLNAGGGKLAFRGDRGVFVLNLTTGEVDHYLKSTYIGLIAWSPDLDTLYVNKPSVHRPESFRIDVRTDRVSKSRSAWSLGFTPDGSECHAVAADVDLVELSCGEGGKSSTTELALPGAEVGDEYLNWSSTEVVVLRKLADKEAFAFERSTGRLIGTMVSADYGVASFLGIHGWLDDERLLFSKDRELVTWEPESGKLEKIGDLPRSNIGGAHGAIGIDFPPLPYR